MSKHVAERACSLHAWFGTIEARQMREIGRACFTPSCTPRGAAHSFLSIFDVACLPCSYSHVDGYEIVHLVCSFNCRFALLSIQQESLPVGECVSRPVRNWSCRRNVHGRNVLGSSITLLQPAHSPAACCRMGRHSALSCKLQQPPCSSPQEVLHGSRLDKTWHAKRFKKDTVGWQQRQSCHALLG